MISVSITIKQAIIQNLATAICKSRSCNGIKCCQWPCNGGQHGDWNRYKTKCPVEQGGYDDAAKAVLEIMHEICD